MVFFPGQGGAFTGGAHGQKAGDAVLNLKVGETGKPRFIDPRRRKASPSQYNILNSCYLLKMSRCLKKEKREKPVMTGNNAYDTGV
jgi:hypothetical protein